jgi:glycosyltransferase involved in cell wall biosynthesis
VRATVAICTWNRCDLLRQTLVAMTRLDVPAGTAWEIVVVDNNCTDNTVDVARSFADVLPIRVVHESAPGLSNARNCAMAAAKSDYVIFTDDDVLVDAHWLTAFIEATERYPEAVGFGGPIEPWFPVTPDPMMLEAFPWLKVGFCGLVSSLPEGPSPSAEIFGANMAYRLSGLDGLRFDPAFGPVVNKGGLGDDTTFVAALRRMHKTIVWLPGMRLQHYVDPSRMTLDYLGTYYAGRGDSHVRTKGVPPGGTLFNAPRWMWRECGRTYLSYALLSLRGMRLESLVQFREHHQLRGMIRGCRALAARPQRQIEAAVN